MRNPEAYTFMISPEALQNFGICPPKNSDVLEQRRLPSGGGFSDDFLELFWLRGPRPQAQVRAGRMGFQDLELNVPQTAFDFLARSHQLGERNDESEPIFTPTMQETMDVFQHGRGRSPRNSNSIPEYDEHVFYDEIVINNITSVDGTGLPAGRGFYSTNQIWGSSVVPRAPLFVPDKAESHISASKHIPTPEVCCCICLTFIAHIGPSCHPVHFCT